MKIQAIANKVIIRRFKAADRSKGGILIPDDAKEKVTRGTVVAVGPEVDGKVMIDSVVMFGKFVGTDIKADDEELVVLKDSDILAIIIEE